MVRVRNILGALLVVALTLGGCVYGDGMPEDDSEHSDGTGEGTDEHSTIDESVPYAGVCGHFIDGPVKTINAVANRDDLMGIASTPLTRVDIQLTDFEGQKGGYVAFDAAGETEYLFFLSEDVLIRAFQGEDRAGFLPVEVFPGGCEQLKAIRKVTFAKGTYHLLIGPTNHHAISLVTSSSATEHNHK